MIDTYHNIKSLNCEDKIKECLGWYLYKDYDDYDAIYDEYDRVNKTTPRRQYDDTNIFFKGLLLNQSVIDYSVVKLRPTQSKFMKECQLESLKRLVEIRTINESKDKDSELNNDIDV
tara:strand:+ start:1826 stop:2176 length:351 start_codon:yes stop_codon:yes gene_type:complete